MGPNVFTYVLHLFHNVFRPSLFSPIFKHQMCAMRHTPLPLYVKPFVANITNCIFYCHHIVKANLDNIFVVHYGNLSINLGGDVIGVLCATSSVDGSWNQCTHHPLEELHDVHQKHGTTFFNASKQIVHPCLGLGCLQLYQVFGIVPYIAKQTFAYCIIG